MIIDCHGHYTTAPAGLRDWRKLQLSSLKNSFSKPRISDQEIRDSLDGAQLKLQRERGIDPETGQYYDDTRRYIDAIDWVSAADKKKIYEGNVRQVYPRIAAGLNGRG